MLKLIPNTDVVSSDYIFNIFDTLEEAQVSGWKGLHKSENFHAKARGPLKMTIEKRSCSNKAQ